MNKSCTKTLADVVDTKLYTCCWNESKKIKMREKKKKKNNAEQN